MREIKFRGKATMSIEELDETHFEHDNCWFIGNLVMFGKTPYIVGDFIEVDYEYTINEFWVPVHTESVGQYTGLKDWQENEVYEHDVVICLLDDEKYIVEWDEIGTGFLFHNVNDGKRTSGIDYYDFEDKCGSFGFEVIGNIYENPELLEVGL